MSLISIFEFVNEHKIITGLILFGIVALIQMYIDQKEVNDARNIANTVNLRAPLTKPINQHNDNVVNSNRLSNTQGVLTITAIAFIIRGLYEFLY